MKMFFQASYSPVITILKLRRDKPDVFIPTCILNQTPGQMFET